MSILLLKDVNLSNIIQTGKIERDGTKMIFLGYNTNNTQKLLFQVPSLPIISYKSDKTTLLLSLKAKNSRDNETVNNFFENMDNVIINMIKMNMAKWGIKKGDMSYRAIVNILDTDSENTGGVIRLKLINDETFKTQVYNDNKTKINEWNYEEVLQKGIYIKSILELYSINYYNGTFTVTIKPHQLKLSKEEIPKEIFLEEYSFIDTDSDEEIESKIVKVGKETVMNTNTEFIDNSTEKNKVSNIKYNLESERNKIMEEENDTSFQDDNELSLEEDDTTNTSEESDNADVFFRKIMPKTMASSRR